MSWIYLYLAVGLIYLTLTLVGQLTAVWAGVDEAQIRMPLWAWPLACLAVVALWPLMLLSLAMGVRRRRRDD